jgi:hypothetical protein
MSLLRVGAIPDDGYNINNSLRFRRSVSAYLSRVPATAGNSTTYTISVWVKRAQLGIEQNIFMGGLANEATNGYRRTSLRFTTNDTLDFNETQSNVSGTVAVSITSALFRDCSAWYHIVARVDTTQATAADRVRLYVNGVQQTIGTFTAYTQNYTTQINTTQTQQIGRSGSGTASHFDGHMAQFYLIDGQSLAPSSFGETNAATGVWQPIRYTGTFGTNGFYMPFSNVTGTTQNLLLNSQLIGGTSWTNNTLTVGTNNVVAPNGTTTASTLTGAGTDSYTVQSFTSVASTTYTFSVWLKSTSNTTINLLAGPPNWTVATCNLTTSWQRFSVTFTSNATTSSVVIGGNNSITSGEVVHAWGVQVVVGSTTTAYMATTTAAQAQTLNFGNDLSVSGTGGYNSYVSNALSNTTGVTYDAMIDSPTLTSATVSNYCTLNPNASFANSTNLRNGVPTPAATISNGNLTYSRVGAASPNAAQLIAGSVAVSSGKWYWEWVASALYTEVIAGIIDDNLNVYGFDNGRTCTQTYNTAITFGATVFTGANGNVYGMAFDADAGTLAIYENNVLRITTTGLPSGRIWRPIFGDSNPAASTTTVDVNFGQRPFTYTPPAGFIRLNTFNLPTPTILKGDVHMDATVYAGNAATPRSITNAASFRPDLVWIKNRSSATFWNILTDSVRGAGNSLFSNSTNAASTNDANGYVSAFNSNGFSTTNGATSTGNVNATGSNYVAWQWKAGQGTTSSNTNGTVTSTVSVNSNAGFSIVSYTGTGVTATVGHGLGVVPKVIIMKNRSATSDWPYFTSAIDGSFDFLFLNTTAIKADASNTPPTSTVFTQSGNANQGASGNLYIAYCFAEIAGFSKFGSFVGNGNALGPFINLGFRPKFVMLKNTAAATQNWVVLDAGRNTFNLTSQILRPNTLDAEVTGTPAANEPIDILSNGFRLRGVGTNGNGSTNVIMYAAFAETPFKYSTAR